MATNSALAAITARSKAKWGKLPTKKAVANTYAKWGKLPAKKAKGSVGAVSMTQLTPKPPGYADLTQGPKVGDAGSRARVVDWADPAAKSGTRANPLNRDDPPPGAGRLFVSEDGDEWWESAPAGSRTSTARGKGSVPHPPKTK